VYKKDFPIKKLAFHSVLLYSAHTINVKNMSQDRVIKLVSRGTSAGVGKGHVRYGMKNKKQNPDKIELRKYNPISRSVTVYKESKK